MLQYSLTELNDMIIIQIKNVNILTYPKYEKTCWFNWSIHEKI